MMSPIEELYKPRYSQKEMNDLIEKITHSNRPKQILQIIDNGFKVLQIVRIEDTNDGLIIIVN